MVARLSTFVAGVLASLVIASVATAAPVVCLRLEGTCLEPSPSTLIETSTFSLELYVVSGAGEYDLFRLDELNWNPAVLRLVDVTPGDLVDMNSFLAGNIDDDSWSRASGELFSGLDSGVLALLDFSVVSDGVTLLRFESLPDEFDLDGDGDIDGPNPFGPLSFQDFDAPQGAPPFGNVMAQTRDAQVTARQVAPVVPEPATLSLLGFGLAGIVARRRYRIRAATVHRAIT